MGPGEVPVWRFGRRRAGKAPLRPLLREAPFALFRPLHPRRHRQGRALRERCAVTAMSGRSVNWDETHPTRTVALNVGGRYLTLGLELLLGLVMLPLNMRYLGIAEYGVWMLAASIVSYF